MALQTSQEYSVNWKNHMSHVRKAFDNLLTSNELTDVTLHCEGKKMGAHKMLLSACSGYFRDTFKDVSCQHPIIFMYGVDFEILSDILRFIYNGEVSVDTSKLDRFLKTAQALRISGLADCGADKIAAVSESITQSTPVEQNLVDQVQESGTLAVTSGSDARKGIKRSKDGEANTASKVMRQENDQVFLTEVKSEPCEMVNFEDLLEDPLMPADQSNDSKDFLGAPGQSLEDEEFKHIIDLRDKLISLKKRSCSSYKQAKKVLNDLDGKLGMDTEEVPLPTRENKRRPVIITPPTQENEEQRPARISDTSKEFQQNLKQRSVIILQNDVVVPPKNTSYAETNTDHDDASTTNRSLLETVLQNQEMMINEILKLNASSYSLIGFIEKVIKPTTTPSTVLETSDESRLGSLQPITSKEKLTELEEELKDENHMQKIVDSMSFVCGRSGTENGLNACYKLVDYFLDRNFVDECSWTGNSKSGGQNPKIALKFYVNFRKCFLNTIRLADREFSELECDNFFKRVLKNSSQRKNAKKIMSASKNRPKNLHYNKKQSMQMLEEPSNSSAQGEEMKNEIEEFSEGEIVKQGDYEEDN